MEVLHQHINLDYELTRFVMSGKAKLIIIKNLISNFHRYLDQN